MRTSIPNHLTPMTPPNLTLQRTPHRCGDFW
jgi:hypothetical protein